MENTQKIFFKKRVKNLTREKREKYGILTITNINKIFINLLEVFVDMAIFIENIIVCE